ncbi:DNA exonuclease A [Aeromonas phage 65]|uniref:Exonuclease A n=2 Tax=Ishigurovirus osborne TaxID=260149 RepID=A0A219YBS2_9CAUD|nr:exonuclease [Aeromonas phage 65]AAR90930.1 DNA exonuclease A [Aeromonas phage 65]APU01400.1 exonuclease A [Aeromonas phage 65.2]
MVTDFIIDFESLDVCESAILIEASIIPFHMDIVNVPTFNSLVSNGIKIKFDIKSQKALGRTTSASTIDWWKRQGDDAKLLLKPSDEDVTMVEGLAELKEFLNKNDISFKKSHFWTRGEMDIIWLRSWIISAMGIPPSEVTNEAPVMFNNFREIRTVIEDNLGRDQTYCPLPVGSLPNFTKHNSLHDCARDVLMVIYSKRYSHGLEDIPAEIDPNSKRGY